MLKEKIKEVKEFVEENQVEILFVATIMCSTAFGIAMGRYSMYEHEKAMIGYGVRSGIDLVKANGLETAESFITQAYKIMK